MGLHYKLLKFVNIYRAHRALLLLRGAQVSLPACNGSSDLVDEYRAHLAARLKYASPSSKPRIYFSRGHRLQTELPS